MIVYVLVKVDFGHREVLGVFNSQAKALALQTNLELELFDNSSLEGISFYVEEHHLR